jgi:hypothetical protein
MVIEKPRREKTSLGTFPDARQCACKPDSSTESSANHAQTKTPT